MSYLAHLVGDQSKFDAFLQVGTGRYHVEVHDFVCTESYKTLWHEVRAQRDPGKDGLNRVTGERKRRWETEMFMRE